jgi:hypothetical protein
MLPSPRLPAGSVPSCAADSPDCCGLRVSVGRYCPQGAVPAHDHFARFAFQEKRVSPDPRCLIRAAAGRSPVIVDIYYPQRVTKYPR